MTVKTDTYQTTHAPKKGTMHMAMGMVMLAAFFLILCFSDIAIEYMKKGLLLCAMTVIPSLFPFMVISELIVSSGVGVRISSLFSNPMRWLFGVSEAGASAYILGLVCGFPIGAKSAVAMYDRGVMTKRELERLLTFCNNPGSAFVISAVGVSLFGNKTVGIALYVCVILSSIAVGFVGKYFLGYKKKTVAPNPMIISSDFSIKAVTDAVQSSAISMLMVCAYVVFFSAFVGCVGALISRLPIPREIISCIFGFFELSSGARAAAEIGDRLRSVILCALFVGWSGLSVGFQIMSVCSGRNISFKPFFIAKAAQGILCALFMGIAVKIFLKDSIYETIPGFPYQETAAMPFFMPLALIYTTLLVTLAIALILGVKRRKSLSKRRKKL